MNNTMKKNVVYLIFLLSVLFVWRFLCLYTCYPFPGSSEWHKSYIILQDISYVYKFNANECNSFNEFKNVLHSYSDKNGINKYMSCCFTQDGRYGYMEKKPTSLDKSQVPMLWKIKPSPEGKIAALFFDMSVKSINAVDFSVLLKKAKDACNRENIYLKNGYIYPYRDSRWFYILISYSGLPLLIISIILFFRLKRSH